MNSCETDADGDGVIGFSCGGTDCNDSDATTFPGNTEVCDLTSPNHDEDCDPQTFGDRDNDRDRWVSSACCNVTFSGQNVCGPDCNDADPSVHPANPDVCDNIDNDCDGAVDEGVLRTLYADDDFDGFGNAAVPLRACATEPGLVANDFDCDDANSSIVPSAMVCAGASTVQTCIDGEFTAAQACPPSLLCAVQPNGTGVCQ